jgi:hypothetical protein
LGENEWKEPTNHEGDDDAGENKNECCAGLHLLIVELDEKLLKVVR